MLLLRLELCHLLPELVGENSFKLFCICFSIFHWGIWPFDNAAISDKVSRKNVNTARTTNDHPVSISDRPLPAPTNVLSLTCFNSGSMIRFPPNLFTMANCNTSGSMNLGRSLSSSSANTASSTGCPRLPSPATSIGGRVTDSDEPASVGTINNNSLNNVSNLSLPIDPISSQPPTLNQLLSAFSVINNNSSENCPDSSVYLYPQPI